MSYFTYLGDSLNNAIENVGNIVAPVDDSFEDDDVAVNDGFDEDTTPDDPALGLDLDEYSSNNASSRSQLIAQQREEIEFLTTKVQSLSIELADRVEREGLLHAQLAECKEKLSALDEKGVDSESVPMQKQREAEDASLRLQDCEAALRASESACQELREKMNSAVPNGAPYPAVGLTEEPKPTRLPTYMSAIRVVTKELSAVVNESYPDGYYCALQDDQTLDAMIDSWSTDNPMGPWVGDDEVRRELKECMWFVGEVANRMIVQRKGWNEISDAARVIRNVLVESEIVGPVKLAGEGTYVSSAVIVLPSHNALNNFFLHLEFRERFTFSCCECSFGSVAAQKCWLAVDTCILLFYFIFTTIPCAGPDC